MSTMEVIPSQANASVLDVDAVMGGFGATNVSEFLPETNASARGSDVTENLAALSVVGDALTDINYIDGIGVECNAEIEGEFEEGGVKLADGEYCIHQNPDISTVEDLESDAFVVEWLEEQKQPLPDPKCPNARKHFLRIINTLNYDEKIMDVGNYETVNDILKFYSEYNSNCKEYVWKDIWGNKLQMNKSLGENGMANNSFILDEIGLDHFPTILLYFKDGFEDEPPMKLDITVPIPTVLGVPCRNY